MIATTADPTLAAGVPAAEAWRLVEATDPGLIATWQAAREACARHDPTWHRRNDDYQRDRGIARRRVPSPHGKALQEATAAVEARLEELIAGGQIVYGGFRSGQLGGDPEIIPLELLAGRRPRGSRLKIRGVDFFDVKLYLAESLRGPGRPTGRTRAPRDADDRLRTWLADVDHADKTIPEITAELVAAHPEILDWWAESTATKRVAAALPVRSNDFRP